MAGLRLRLTVAKIDGVVGRDGVAFMPGSIAPSSVNVIKSESGDADGLWIGWADLHVDGDDLVADLIVTELSSLTGLYPSLFFTVNDCDHVAAERRMRRVSPVALVFAPYQNADVRIGPVPDDSPSDVTNP